MPGEEEKMEKHRFTTTEVKKKQLENTTPMQYLLLK